MKNSTPSCAHCHFAFGERNCMKEHGKCHATCPTVHCNNLANASIARAKSEQLQEFVYQASIQEGTGYTHEGLPPGCVRPVATRLQETAQFARRMQYTRLGLAFCMGLREEASVVSRYFEEYGFTVVSAGCKVGRVYKSELNLSREHQVLQDRDESMCNPIMQAMIMNEQHVDFNILVGLCVGHDSLFLKHAEAPCTVLIAKDRLLAHNPVGAVYQYDAYYRFLEKEAHSAKEINGNLPEKNSF